jgi:hypothetical protein
LIVKKKKKKEQGDTPVNKMYMEAGLKVDPVDPATLIFLSSKDICNEVVPVEEPVVEMDHPSRPCWLHRPSRSRVSYMLQIISWTYGQI